MTKFMMISLSERRKSLVTLYFILRKKECRTTKRNLEVPWSGINTSEEEEESFTAVIKNFIDESDIDPSDIEEIFYKILNVILI